MRALADIATAARMGISAYILYAGLRLGRDAFGSVAAAFLFGWILDTVDGTLARASGSDQGPSWLGRQERKIDLIMVLATFFYLTLIGFVPAWATVAYLLVAAMLLARLRSIALLTALEIPMVLVFLLAAFLLEPLWGWIYVLSGLVGAFIDRKRLRVRLRILWDDVRHRKSDHLSPSERGRNNP